MPEKQELNKSSGTIVRLLCNRCDNNTAHKVLVSVLNSGNDGNAQHSVEWAVEHQLLECLGCQEVTYKSISTNSEDYDYSDETGGLEYVETIVLFPPRMAGQKGLVDGYVVPRPIMSLYLETRQALVGGSPILSGIGLRALIETICKERNADGRDLHQKIGNLVAQQVLTPQGAEVLHHIRTLGNQAAHEAKPHDVKQLSLAMEVIEHLMKDVYIIPAKVETLFKARVPPPPPLA